MDILTWGRTPWGEWMLSFLFASLSDRRDPKGARASYFFPIVT